MVLTQGHGHGGGLSDRLATLPTIIDQLRRSGSDLLKSPFLVVSGGHGGRGGEGQNGGDGGDGGSVDITVARETVDDLKSLPGWYLDGVKFNESKICLPGTRKQLLRDIHKWVDSYDEKRIIWLSGGAGTGKTSVAHSIAFDFYKRNRLAACFFFNRDIEELNNPRCLFGNLCYQLAHFDYHRKFGIKDEILSAIQSMGHITSYTFRTQTRRLIVDPAKVARLNETSLVVIDALDECGTPVARKELLDAICMELPELPSSIKVIITSRDEPDIQASLTNCSKEESVDATREDVATYIRYRLRSIQDRSSNLQGWPGTKKLGQLTSRAEGLFIWASLACNFIEEKWDPVQQLDYLLKVTGNVEKSTMKPLEKLHLLYDRILRDAFPENNAPFANFRYIVGSIAALETPLSQSELDLLLGLQGASASAPLVLKDGLEIPSHSSNTIISPLRSILRTDSTDSVWKGSLRLLHPSLYEFLTDHANEDFRIDSLEQDQILAIRCLKVMNSHLEFDICHIGDPSLLNKEIKNLPERIKNYIPDGLRYSCRSMGYHLRKSLPDTILNMALETFLSEHLLHWIEVMSLIGEVTKAESCLHLIAGWIKENTAVNAHDQALVMDAIPFLRNFGNVIRLSSLHTYYSALPLMPKTTDLFSHFTKDLTPPFANIICPHPTWHPASLRVMEGHIAEVSHVVFSPDGKTLASASGDKTVRFWDIESGESIGEPLIGHTDFVNHVTFSPDGHKLASASNDGTVRLWDVENGQTIGEPLIHTDRVFLVVFSPDGHKLASASDDELVRLWDVNRCEITMQSLEGHTDLISHVVFSPDGKCLASASYDNSVRLWDVERGQAKGAPLNGHADLVNYVEFSPDGKMLVSASYDTRILFWDVESGQSIREPLQGHTDRISHLVFSPHGEMLASASDDDTVRLWDLQSAQTKCQVLEGHTDSVRRLAFSPDGTKLASASDDTSVWLWAIEHGRATGEALIGHTNSVLRVSFSPDGNQLASSSRDRTVRIWDAEGGQGVRDVFQGHTSSVSRVVFSPDGRKLASVAHDATVWLWNVENDQPNGECLRGHTDLVRHVVFSPDGEKLASASDDKTVRLWDIRAPTTSCRVLDGHLDLIFHVVFSPDGKLLASASHDNTVRLWSVESCRSIGKPLKGHTDRVFHVAFSPDGDRLASVSEDGTVCLWDIKRREVLLKALKGRTDLVRDILFSPSGQNLVTLSHDNSVQLWDIKSGKAIGDPFKPCAEYHHPGQMKLLMPELTWLSQDFGTITESGSDSRDITQRYSVDKLASATMSFDALGFLRVGGRARILWLPPMLRGSSITVHHLEPLLVAVGSISGAITVIKFPR